MIYIIMMIQKNMDTFLAMPPLSSSDISREICTILLKPAPFERPRCRFEQNRAKQPRKYVYFLFLLMSVQYIPFKGLILRLQTSVEVEVGIAGKPPEGMSVSTKNVQVISPGAAN